MFCSSCGTELPDGSKFCTKCGSSTGEGDSPSQGPLDQGQEETPVQGSSNPATVGQPGTTGYAPPAAEGTGSGGKPKKLITRGTFLGLAALLGGKLFFKLVEKNTPKQSNGGSSGAQGNTLEQVLRSNNQYDSFISEFQNSFLSEYSQLYGLTDADVSVVGNVLKAKLVSSVSSRDANARQLRANFEQEVLSQGAMSEEKSSIASFESQFGITGLSSQSLLYYADGTLCGGVEATSSSCREVTG